ncbi:type IV pilin protein [Psychromonas sp. PT13]|uniref:type IV pilin protein n=1 Tax=Psychromonas sp. PT13 TaxID=3439547 RepID=UPI003EB7AF30
MKRKNGFTLIELLIAVAIVGILASIAYPSYMDSVTRSRRADAQAALLGFAQAMERHYTTTGGYTGAGTTGGNTGAPTIFSTKSPIDGSDTYYNLTIESAAVTTYTLKATAVGSQLGDGDIQLSSTGARSGNWN